MDEQELFAEEFDNAWRKACESAIQTCTRKALHSVSEIKQLTGNKDVPLSLDHVEEPISDKVTVPLLAFVQTKVHFMLAEIAGKAQRNELNVGHGDEWARRVFKICGLISELDRLGMERSMCGMRLCNPPAYVFLEALKQDLTSRQINSNIPGTSNEGAGATEQVSSQNSRDSNDSDVESE